MFTGSKSRSGRIAVLAIVAGLALTGCSTTAVSTHGVTGSIGTDNYGNDIGAAWPSIPHSNQVSLFGDRSARELQLGKENFRGANYGKAENHFRKAVEIRPDNASAWAGLAASYDQLGRFDLADRAYDQLGNLRKGDARIVNNRGYSYLLRGDYEKAESWLKRALVMDPTLEEADGNLILLEKVRST